MPRSKKDRTPEEIAASRKHKKETAIQNMKLAQTAESRRKQAESRKTNTALKTLIYDELKTALVKDGPKGAAYYQDFLNNFLAMAKKDPNSRCGQTVGQVIFQQDLLALLDEQHEKEMMRDRDFQQYRLIKDFFKEQREVIVETNHSKRVIACCSRRAGKTDLASGAINYAAIIPDSRIIYINLTFTNAINQIWNNTLKRAEDCGLQVSKKSKADGTVEFSNGSSLRIMGNPNNSEIEKLRGESKVSLVVIDEFFHQRNMQYAIDEVISPLLADRTDSTILCIGTPPRLAKTFGEKCWSESGWKKFHWTMFDNPYMPDPMNYLEDYCRNKGITLESPFVQREYFGKIGIYDTEALVFKGRQIYNAFDKDSTSITDVAIGVDYGFTDYNSVITVAYNKRDRRSWVVKEDKFNRAGVSAIVEKIQEHFMYGMELARLNRLPQDSVRIFCDTNAQDITFDLVTKYHMPAFNCHKYDKMYAIEMLAEELRTGRMRIPHNGILDDEMDQILYKRDSDTDSILPELDEEIGIHADAMMALLYASRRVFFDMDYEIGFKQSSPAVSRYETDERGTITGVKADTSTPFEDSGIIG